jgi:hypothetical protein
VKKEYCPNSRIIRKPRLFITVNPVFSEIYPVGREKIQISNSIRQLADLLAMKMDPKSLPGQTLNSYFNLTRGLNFGEYYTVLTRSFAIWWKKIYFRVVNYRLFKHS